MTKYAIESFGFNDGHPYEEFTTDSFGDAQEQFTLICEDQPRVGHRLIQLLEEREAINQS